MSKNATVEHRPVPVNSYRISLRPYLIFFFFFQLHVVVLMIAEEYGCVL